MSVAGELRAPPHGTAGEPEAQFDRTPPQDVAAEQSVLGGMMLSKDAIADVVEILRSTDFYRPANATIFDAILDLYGRGDPADPVTVTASLTDAGTIGRVGGMAYVHDLVHAVPTAANTAYYARIVAERAVLRRLVEAGTKIVQLGYGAAAGVGRDVDDVVDLAQQAVYDVTERRVSEDFQALAEVLQPTLDEIEAIGAQGGVMTGVPTGFTDLDALLNGLHPGQLIVVAGRPGLGKALALDTPLPTPDGWTTMGEVRVGDRLLSADGSPTTVVAVSDIQVGRPCYEVVFSDGSTIIADGAHRWPTHTRRSRRYGHKPQVHTTDEIRATLRTETKDQRLNHSVTNARPLALPARDLPLPPYALGVWLGDGSRGGARFTTDDPEIVARIEEDGLLVHPSGPRCYTMRLPPPLVPARRQCVVCGRWFQPRAGGVRTCGRFCGGKARLISAPIAQQECIDCGVVTSGTTIGAFRCWPCHTSTGSVTSMLRELGVIDDKHIPLAYLRGSEAQRRALLAGLLDTDGTVAPAGNVQYTSTSRRLAEGVYELVTSLGHRATVNRKAVAGRTPATSTAYTVNFSTIDEVFHLERKQLAHKQRRRSHTTARTGSRYIVTVRAVPSIPVRCVAVDHPSRLFLAGHAMIPTHNSAASLDVARHAALRQGLASAIFSLEMSKVEIVMRVLSAESRVPLHVLRSGQLSDDDWTKLARRMGEISEAPLFIDDTPNMTLMEIRAKARRLRQRHDLKLLVVDYLQLMTSAKRVENRQQEVSELSRGLKLLAKEIDCPVIGVAQLNRGPEQRTDKRPQLSDLRESGCLTVATRVVRADTNQEVTLGELMRSGERNVPVWALDDRLKYVPGTMTHVFPSGRKEVFRLRLASGRDVEASANHPFLTFSGWTQLGQLTVGSRIASPRRLPEPQNATSWTDEEVVLLAHLLGDGSFVPHQLRLFCLRSHEKFIPPGVFSLPTEQVALFLRHLWATDGSVTVSRNGRSGRIYYGSTSRTLLNGVAMLLLRFGITARVRDVTPGPYRPQFTLDISGRDDQLRFLRNISVHGARSEACAKLLTILDSVAGNANVDTVPKEVWNRVRELLSARGMSHREFSAAIDIRFCGSTLWKHAPSRQRLARVAAVLDSADLALHATNDVFWDQVVSIEPLGERDVYDATVLDRHNFVANGIAVHNSIEQDSDVVILLHRDDYYDRESPRAGEADFIVAKHRNGPTDTITVAAQLHLSRFVDMAVG